MNSRKQTMESTVAGSMGMRKYIVKNNHCRIAEMTFAALALVYLKPWVTMLETRSKSSSTKKIVTEHIFVGEGATS